MTYYLAVDSGAELLGKEYNVATAHIYAIVYYWRRR